MKKSVLGIIALSLIASNDLSASDVLTGDTKLACEAILCLSSAVRPAECSASLVRYFSIHFKKPWKTLNARRAFLNLCPVQNNVNTEDLVLKNLVNDVLPSVDPRQCTVEYLNTRVEGRARTGYRINPNMPYFCHSLIHHQYTDYKMPKYKCSGEFYSALEWRLSAKLERVDYKQYKNLREDQRYFEVREDYDEYRERKHYVYYYYKKTPFSKVCWTY